MRSMQTVHTASITQVAQQWMRPMWQIGRKVAVQQAAAI